MQSLPKTSTSSTDYRGATRSSLRFTYSYSRDSGLMKVNLPLRHIKLCMYLRMTKKNAQSFFPVTKAS